MDFRGRISFSRIVMVGLGVFLSGCGVTSSDGTNLIGSELTASSLASDQSQVAAVYDREVGVIQEFEIQTMNVRRQIEVENTHLEHNLLISSGADYIVDFTTKHVAVYPNGGTANVNPFKVVGTPKSAAYYASAELVAVYDDLANVGLMKLSSGGKEVKSWVGGPLIGTATITAGDFSADGALVLVFSDNSMAVADVEASIDGESWSVSNLNPAITEANWVAPISGQNNQVVTHSKEGLSLVNTTTGAVLSQYSTAGLTLIKLSKKKVPHGLFKTSSGSLKMVYLNGSSFSERTLQASINEIMFSALDVSGDNWLLIDRSFAGSYSLFNDPNQYSSDRRLLSFRLSDLKTNTDLSIPGGPEVFLTSQYLFSLFPSQLGYATRTEITSESVTVKERFNFELFRRRNLQ